MAGAEVEYASCAAFQPIRKWAKNWGAEIQPDGSCGWEAVTAPAAGDKMVAQAFQLVKAMQEAKCRVNDSCGVHVHVDARDLTPHDITRLCAVWAIVEPAMFLIGGQQRVRSQWCRPVGKKFEEALTAKKKQSALLAAFLDTSEDQAAERMQEGIDKKDGARYKAMNLCPWLAGRYVRVRHFDRASGKYKSSKTYTTRKDCTIEFRLHRDLNKLDEQRLVGWMKLLCRLVEWVATHKQSDVDALPRNGMRALVVIAPDCERYLTTRLRDWKKATKRSGRSIKYRRALQGWEYQIA